MARAFALAVEAGRIGYPRRSDARAGHGRAFDAGDRTRFRRSLRVLDPFYLIVDSAAWIARLLPCGVRLVQLRIKDKPDETLRAEIEKAKGALRAARRKTRRQ